jgi:hypothetical protein
MPRIHVVDTGETANDITSSKLQSYLCASPDCVILPGRYNILEARFNEMKIYPCRGSGFMFGGAPGALPIFRQPICIEDLTVGGPYSGDGLIRLGCGNSSRFEDRDITFEEIKEAVKGSGLLHPQNPITLEAAQTSAVSVVERKLSQLELGDLLHPQMKLPTPLDNATIMQDLDILPKLKNVRIIVGDISILPNRGWGRASMSSPSVPYNTVQELLQELKTLPDTYDEEKWIQFSKPYLQHNANMDFAKGIRNMIPNIVRETHRTIATLFSQLSPCVRECLKAGLPIQTIEDALDSRLQEANYLLLI